MAQLFLLWNTEPIECNYSCLTTRLRLYVLSSTTHVDNKRERRTGYLESGTVSKKIIDGEDVERYNIWKNVGDLERKEFKGKYTQKNFY